MRRFIRRIATLFRFHKAEDDLAREIGAHLQLLEDKYVAQGMTPDDARFAARREFGGVEQAKELHRDARSFRWLAGWPMDLKLGARMLVRSPGLTVIAVIALAVAIGAGAAYLEFTRDLLHPVLDGPRAERLVGITVWNAERRTEEPYTVQDLSLLRASSRSLEEIGAARPIRQDLTTPDGLTESVRAVEISATAFRLIPATPVMGRALHDDDEKPGAPPVAVVAHQVWKSRLNGDAGALGSALRFGSSTFTLVGVMPEGFGFPENQNVWLPLQAGGAITQMFGRLADGATLAGAEADAQVLVQSGGRNGSATPGGRSAIRAHVRPYVESILAEERSGGAFAIVRSVNILFVMLLAICGANVATLVFARTAVREGEITVRTALGASRARISAQLFAEALVLSSLAAGAGLVAATILGRWAKRVFEQGIGPTPFWWDDGLGYQTVLYAFALAVLAAVIVGVTPALKATGPQLQGRLREGASGTSTMKFGGIWTTVIVLQAAITVVFLSAVVSLGIGSFRKASGADVTYPRDHLLVGHVVFGPSTPDPAAKAGAHRRIAERLRIEPGVAGVSYASALPGTIWEQTSYEFQSPELQAQADARKVTETLWSEGASVGEAFFETVGIPLVSGRLFTAADMRAGASVAIVDETFVRTVLGGRSPLGVVLRERPAITSREPGPWVEIVGVVKDASLRERNGPDDASLYRPATPGRPMRLLVRTSGPAAAMRHRVYAAARAVDPDIRLFELKSLAQVVEDDGVPERMFLRAFMVVSAIALLLATAGIYALISFTLARRTREIGIRVALGAAPRRIISGVFLRAFRQVGLGVLAGGLPALVVMQATAGDVGSMNLAGAAAATLGVCGFVVAVALISCLIPLRSALRIDPVRALRAE